MVYREDLVASSAKGKRYGTLNILGFSIDADKFLSDAIKESFSDISSAGNDAAEIKAATFLVVGQRDAWVRTSDVQLVFGMINSKPKEILVLPAMLHRLLENPATARYALTQTVKFAVDASDWGRQSPHMISVPDKNDVSAREGLEKEHLKKIYAYSKSDERHFLERISWRLQIHYERPRFL